MTQGWGRINSRELIEVFAGFEVERLERLLAAVEEWDRFVRDRLDVAINKAQDSQGQLSEWVYERFGDEASSIQETKRILCAGIAVTIASMTEALTASVCHYKNPNLPLKDKKGRRIAWGRLRQMLETDLGMSLSSLPGYAGAQRARMLGNCFKHRRGRADEEVEAEVGIAKGSDVEFEKEDWRKMIDDTKVFLLALAGQL